MCILVEGLRKLVEDSEHYSDHIQREAPINIEFHLTDTDEKATLTISKTLSVNQGSHNPDIKLTMKKETFNKIISGESDFGSMIGRSKISDKRPIDMKFINRDKTKQIMSTLYALMNHFFFFLRLKVKKLDKKFAGYAHGAHPIPLVYWDEIRSAYYHIDEGETLNEAGEKDPYPQVLVLIKGEGVAYIGGKMVEVSAGEAVYIPVNTIHKITAEEDMELIWIAWKTPLF